MSWTHFRDTTHKARKRHWCLVCNEAIEVGEVYAARTGVEDVVYTFRMHLECKELSSDWDQEDWECHSPGDVERPKAKAEVRP